MQFGTTALFLRCFGLTSLEDLPPVQEQAPPMLPLSLEEAENSEKG
jgi:chromosome segregation and condensation protein ScpB